MDPITIRFYLRMLGYGLAIAAALFLGSKVYGWIFDRGAESVQVLWDKETADYNAEIARLKTEFNDKEVAHRDTNRKLNDDLAQARLDNANALAAAQLDFAQRLRNSEQRSAVYQRQAQGGTAQCGDLANHAARLDASLEEGRFVVRELRDLVGLRDRQILALSAQIRNDRTLIEEETP